MTDSTDSVQVEPESIVGCTGEAKALFEAMPAGICVCDARSSAVLWHNTAAKRLWGGPPKYAITGNPVLIDRPQGGRVAILKEAPLRDADEQVVAILNILEDVTELHRTRAEVSELQEWRRLAVDTAELGTFDLDFGSQRTLWSDRARSIFGIPEHVSPDMEMVRSLIHPDDRAHVDRVGRKAADPCGDGSYADEFRIVRPGGEVRSILIRGTFLFEGGGSGRRAVRVFGTVLDVTQRKHTDAALRDASNACVWRSPPPRWERGNSISKRAWRPGGGRPRGWNRAPRAWG